MTHVLRGILVALVAVSACGGKDNGSTEGFRVEIPGKGRYMLKADDAGSPERASAASVIGADVVNWVAAFAPVRHTLS